MTAPTQPQPVAPQPQQPQQPQYQPPQQPAKAKKPIYKRAWFWIIVVVVVALIYAAGSGNKGKSTSTSSAKPSTSTSQAAPAAPDPSTAKVEMQATATGSGTATWGEAGSTSQETFSQNWSKTITGDDAKKGYILTVMGDVTGGNDQKVSCTVLVNGQQKSHKDASGAAGTVTCDTTGIFN